MSDADKITATIRDYIALSEGARFAEKRAFWDTDEASPVLAPEESRVLTGWAEIKAYWTSTSAAVSSFRTEILELMVVPLCTDHALAVFSQRWTATMRDTLLGHAPIAATVRVAMALRKKPDGWRIYSSVESHLDGLVFFEERYRGAATMWDRGL